jgi:hypothetical protein
VARTVAANHDLGGRHKPAPVTLAIFKMSRPGVDARHARSDDVVVLRFGFPLTPNKIATNISAADCHPPPDIGSYAAVESRQPSFSQIQFRLREMLGQ